MNQEIPQRDGEQIYLKMIYSVWFTLGFYTFIYGWYEAWMCALTTGIGASAIVPYCINLQKKGKILYSKILFVSSCNFYIYMTSLSGKHQTSSEYYYIVAIMLPALIFNLREKKVIYLCTFISLGFWLLTEGLGANFVPDYLVADKLPLQAFTRINFLGAFCLTLIFLSDFVGTIRSLNKELIEKKIKESEVLEESVKTKSLFLATMSHEIRTPMNGVLGMTQLLHESNLPPEQKEMVHTIKTCGESLMVIIDDILDFSKIESECLRLESHEMKIETIVNDVLNLFSSLCHKKDIQVEKNIDSNIPEFLLGDETRVKQLLTNIISNAIKFTDSGGKITVNIKGKWIESKTFELIFSVADTGIGIRKEDQEVLFKAFTQADISITRKFGGTGLGLAICSKLIELMDGKISLESEFGVGTTMTITMPLESVEVEKNEHDTSSSSVVSLIKADQSKLSLPKNRILVVEDDIINQKVALMIIKKLGFECDVALNGLEALECLNHKKYTLVFMDMMMPEMDGITATKKIIEKFGDDKPFIVAMTANVLDTDKEKCFKSGMDDFVPKPIQIEDLRRVIEKYLSLSEEDREVG